MHVQDNNSNNQNNQTQPGTDPATQQQAEDQQPTADQQPSTEQPVSQPAAQTDVQPPAEPKTQPPAEPETQEQGSDYVSSYTPPDENEVPAAGEAQTEGGEDQPASEADQPAGDNQQPAEQSTQDQSSQPATITPPPSVQPASPEQPEQPEQEEQPTSAKPETQPSSEESSTTPAAQSTSSQQDREKLDVDLDKEIERLEKMVQDLEANAPQDEKQAETKTTSEPEKTDENKPAQEKTPEAPPTAEPPKPPKPESANKPTSDQPESTTPSASDQPKPAQASSSNQPTSQKLADQNIFFLLGVEDGTDEEKNKFLDELQQVVWEDFLENDMDKVVTGPEKEQVKAIIQDDSLSELDQQEKALSLLEKTLPNFEDLMIEKAMELKSDLFKERIAGMKEYYAQDQASLDKIAQAETQLQQENWRSAAEILNQLIAKPKTQT